MLDLSAAILMPRMYLINSCALAWYFTNIKLMKIKKADVHFSIGMKMIVTDLNLSVRLVFSEFWLGFKEKESSINLPSQIFWFDLDGDVDGYRIEKVLRCMGFIIKYLMGGPENQPPC